MSESGLRRLLIVITCAVLLLGVGELSDVGLADRLSTLLAKPVILVVDPMRKTTIPEPDSANMDSYRKFLERHYNVTTVDGIAVADLDWSPHLVLLNRRAQYQANSSHVPAAERDHLFTMAGLAAKAEVSAKTPRYFDPVVFAYGGEQKDFLALSGAMGAALGLTKSGEDKSFNYTVDPKKFRAILTNFAAKRRIDPDKLNTPEDYDFAKATYGALTEKQLTGLAESPSTGVPVPFSVPGPLATVGRAKFAAFMKSHATGDAKAVRDLYMAKIDFQSPVGKVSCSLADLPVLQLRGIAGSDWYSF